MKVLQLIITLLISLIISVIDNFDAKSISSLIALSLVETAVIFLLLTILITSVRHLKTKNFKKFILFGILFLILLIVALVVKTVFIFSASFCTLELSSGVFRTNTVTGECSIGQHPGCGPWPWYYKEGCELSVEEKFEIFSLTNGYQSAILFCERLCSSGNDEFFCQRIFAPADISLEYNCSDITTCESISCS